MYSTVQIIATQDKTWNDKNCFIEITQLQIEKKKNQFTERKNISCLIAPDHNLAAPKHFFCF